MGEQIERELATAEVQDAVLGPKVQCQEYSHIYPSDSLVD
jgi:hypothetical protein